MRSIRAIIKNLENFFVYRVLHVDDTPHRLALGIALGIFIGWTPTVGFQMMLVLLLAPLIGANGRVGVPFVWVSNPFTFGLIYYPNYLLGSFLLQHLLDRTPTFTFEEIQVKLLSLHGIGYVLDHLWEKEFWARVAHFIFDVSLDMWVGSLLVALFMAIISYIASYRLIVWYRTHHRQFRLHLRHTRGKKDVPPRNKRTRNQCSPGNE